MVALDVSQSMLAGDIKPSRLERAKLEIRDLTQKLHGDELGVVLFSGASFVQVPLTSDYTTALNYLENAGPSLISRSGTVIGDAIRMAAQAFDPKLASQKVLIVMTDGEDVESNPVEAAQSGGRQGRDDLHHRLWHARRANRCPRPIGRARSSATSRMPRAKPVISKMDEATLQKIADAGHGQYFRATPDGSELTSLLSQIDGLQKAQLQSARRHPADRALPDLLWRSPCWPLALPS